MFDLSKFRDLRDDLTNILDYLCEEAERLNYWGDEDEDDSDRVAYHTLENTIYDALNGLEDYWYRVNNEICARRTKTTDSSNLDERIY